MAPPPSAMSAVATKLQENGACFEANPFMTLKTAALMNSNRAAKRTTVRGSRAAQLSGDVSLSKRRESATNGGEEKGGEADDYLESSASTRHGAEDEFEADDDFEEQIMCAFLLEQMQKGKRSSNGSNSAFAREEDGESMTFTTETMSLSSRDSSSRFHNSAASNGNSRKNNNKSLHSLDDLIGDTGETMRLASSSRTSRDKKRGSGSRRNARTDLAGGEVEEDEDIFSEALSHERRRSSNTNPGSSRNSMRSERTSQSATSSGKPNCIGPHTRRRSDDNSNSKSGRSLRRTFTADDSRRSTTMDASSNTGSQNSNMDSSSAVRRSVRGRRTSSLVADNNSSATDVMSDMIASAPSTPSRRSRIHDRSRSSGKSSIERPGGVDDADDAAVDGSITPNNSKTNRLTERPNSMELRRVVRDPSRRGRRATLGRNILMRNLQLQDLEDQHQDGSDFDGDADDDDCVFDADFGDRFLETSGRMGGSERHYSTTSSGNKTDVWQQRRMAKPASGDSVPQRVSRASRQGSIQAATAVLLAQPEAQEEKVAAPGFQRSHTTSSIAQRRSRLRGPGP